MSAAKYTPGPWTLDRKDMAHVVDENYHSIHAGCGYHAPEERVHPKGFQFAGHMSAADARLIAASPELLEAAIAAEQALRYLAGTLHADRLAAAIAKATGSAA